jgi:DivIVA domain-containing protein
VNREFVMAMRGYSRREVDELFARIDAGQVTAEELEAALFSKQVRGYSPRQVDEALDKERRRLRG